ncbi:MAG: non-canonical purine NTP pyrophosphatase, partial [Bacteroidota bacterium]|nr:non-canonical purine NTP pyrophosphatase [Bacteroidota bacterium]
DSKMLQFEGIVNGTITTEPKGTNGFGYDPIFQPIGYDKTYAEMSNKEKNSMSHRTLALNKLSEYISNSNVDA